MNGDLRSRPGAPGRSADGFGRADPHFQPRNGENHRVETPVKSKQFMSHRPTETEHPAGTLPCMPIRSCWYLHLQYTTHNLGSSTDNQQLSPRSILLKKL